MGGVCYVVMLGLLFFIYREVKCDDRVGVSERNVKVKIDRKYAHHEMREAIRLCILNYLWVGCSGRVFIRAVLCRSHSRWG